MCPCVGMLVCYNKLMSLVKQIRKHLIIFFVIVAILIGAVVAAIIYAVNNNDESTSAVSGQSITVEGEYECLPKPGDGPHTLECALGIKVDEDGKDVHYGLEFLGSRDAGVLPEQAQYEIGERLRVSGIFHQEESQYDSPGYIEVESIARAE